ncbi:MAG: phospholipid/cholesterol/gamma-HCH transport system substrate-binding protein, partial [Baekduia sp.]|nr:phospholipid/cholesterol/gamma-HCH transport system substrate-binding protein [Baekduia sp.]
MNRSRIIPIAGVAVVAVIAAVIVLGGGGGAHKLRGAFAATEQLAPGQELRIAGRKIGEVGSIDLVDGNAVAELKIYDNDVWPLHVGTKAAIRWGSTTSLAYRYAELYPGPANKPALPDNALLTRSQTITPVELDTSYRIF